MASGAPMTQSIISGTLNCDSVYSWRWTSELSVLTAARGRPHSHPIEAIAKKTHSLARTRIGLRHAPLGIMSSSAIYPLFYSAILPLTSTRQKSYADSRTFRSRNGIPEARLPKAKIKRLYLIPILSRALDVLELLEETHAPVTLEDVYQRTQISKTSVYRILKTLVHRGYVLRLRMVNIVCCRAQALRFGFGAQSARCLSPWRSHIV